MPAGLAHTSIAGWKRGAIPTLKSLIMVASLTGTSLDDLVAIMTGNNKSRRESMGFRDVVLEYILSTGKQNLVEKLAQYKINCEVLQDFLEQKAPLTLPLAIGLSNVMDMPISTINDIETGAYKNSPEMLTPQLNKILYRAAQNN